MALELVMVGTGSPLPDASRAGPSQLVGVDGRWFLFDAGRGCLMRLLLIWILKKKVVV